MSEKEQPPQIGTMDHYEDICAHLDALNVHFLLVIGEPNTNFTRVYSSKMDREEAGTIVAVVTEHFERYRSE